MSEINSTITEGKSMLISFADWENLSTDDQWCKPVAFNSAADEISYVFDRYENYGASHVEYLVNPKRKTFEYLLTDRLYRGLIDEMPIRFYDHSLLRKDYLEAVMERGLDENIFRRYKEIEDQKLAKLFKWLSDIYEIENDCFELIQTFFERFETYESYLKFIEVMQKDTATQKTENESYKVLLDQLSSI